MRKPKNMEPYVSRDEAIGFLIGATYRLLSRPTNEMVKVNIQVSFWNDDWLDKSKEQPVAACSGMTYKTVPKKKGKK